MRLGDHAARAEDLAGHGNLGSDSTAAGPRITLPIPLTLFRHTVIAVVHADFEGFNMLIEEPSNKLTDKPEVEQIIAPC